MSNLTSLATVMSNGSSMASSEAPPHQDLLPTLLQIFLTVGLGWLSGSTGMFGATEARGVHMFISKFSLPSLIFISLASLDLTNIKWSFLLAVLVSKSIIFFSVLLMELLLNWDISRAALFAIYSTQTNDFGIGLPILNSVFDPDHTFVGLIYLVTPISLLFLNPIGFILLEIDKENRREKHTSSHLASVMEVFKGLLRNPVVVMTILGILGNFSFSSAPPPHLAKFLDSLGSAFSALAPFSLGLGMVGKLAGIRGNSIKAITALVAVKTIVAPILTYMMVDQITALLDEAPDPSLSNFALLLGAFPTALGVASYATEYQVTPDLVSAAIVLGTLASAPMLYLVASILNTLHQSPEAVDIPDHSWIDCIISIVSVTIVLGLLLSRTGWQRALNMHTILMLLLTLVASTMELHNSYQHHPVLAIIHLLALHASRLSAAALAIHLLRPAGPPAPSSISCSTVFLFLLGPVLALLTLLLLLTPYSPRDHLVYGPSEDYLSLAVNSVSLAPTLTCVILLGRSTSRPGQKVFRHSLLLLVLAIAMFTSISLSLGRIISTSNAYLGAFKALNCINGVMSSGQGLLFLGVFGLDQTSRLLEPLSVMKRRLKLICNKRERAAGMVKIEESGPSTESKVTKNPAAKTICRRKASL